MAAIACWLVGGIIAVYLSWSCNTHHGFGMGSKIVFAIFPFLSSWGYLLNYLFFKAGTCNPEASMRALEEVENFMDLDVYH